MPINLFLVEFYEKSNLSSNVTGAVLLCYRQFLSWAVLVIFFWYFLTYDLPLSVVWTTPSSNSFPRKRTVEFFLWAFFFTFCSVKYTTRAYGWLCSLGKLFTLVSSKGQRYSQSDSASLSLGAITAILFLYCSGFKQELMHDSGSPWGENFPVCLVPPQHQLPKKMWRERNTYYRILGWIRS